MIPKLGEAQLRATIEWIRDYVQGLPGGIDYDADPDDDSPEDMTAHMGGLIWGECVRVLEETKG